MVVLMICVLLLCATLSVCLSRASVEARRSVRNTQAQQRKPEAVAGYYSFEQYFSEFRAPQSSALSSHLVAFDDISQVFYYRFRTDEFGNIFGGNATADANILFGPRVLSPHQPSQSPDPVVDGKEEKKGELCCSHDAPSIRNCVRRDTSQGLIRRLHGEHKPVFVSIDGFGVKKDNTFALVAGNSSARRVFAQQSATILADYGFDGILLGWFYPHPEFDDWGDSIGDDHYYDDSGAYKLLLNDIYAELQTLSSSSLSRTGEGGREYILSAYLSCDRDEIRQYKTLAFISEQLTENLAFSYWTEGHLNRNIRYEERESKNGAKGNGKGEFAVYGANSGYCLKLYAKTDHNQRNKTV